VVTGSATPPVLTPAVSPIVKALSFLSRQTTGEVHVHIVSKFYERDVLGGALKVFDLYDLSRTTHRNGVLIYVNRSTQKFAVIADEGIHRAVGQRYWDELTVNMKEDFLGTYFENAIALTVFTLAVTLKKHFPIQE
jgi:uncharacterized membrane protein